VSGSHDHPAENDQQASQQPRLALECRPQTIYAALYDELPFPNIGPVQELAFDVGVTAVDGSFSLTGMVVRGYARRQLLFEQRWPERFIRRKTGLDNLEIRQGTGIAVRAMHFHLHGYERLTFLELTAVGKSCETHDSYEAVVHVPVAFPQVQTDLHFPLAGTWWAIQAADWSDLHKAEVFSQPYAIDLVKLGPNNHFFRNGGLRLEDHESWNQPVYAAADGKIAYTCDDMPDIPPGAIPEPDMFRDDPRRLLGNAVAISHGNGEFSYYAHLQQASVAVKYGEMVRRGALIGMIGSSGNSPGPHLHFHIMNGPNLQIDQGLPLKMSHFSAGGQFFKKPITIPTRMLVTGPARGQEAMPER
jgi:hypothetical protein